MTKKELITTIADEANISKAAAEKALNAVIEGITDALSN